jgi:hypothetical protein
MSVRNTEDNMSKRGSVNQVPLKVETQSIRSHPSQKAISQNNLFDNTMKGNSIPGNDGVNIPYVKGDKTIQCWNCESILVVKEEWTVVQCPNCEKINKIPKRPQQNNVPNIRFNNNLNHFDLNLPYVVSSYEFIYST